MAQKIEEMFGQIMNMSTSIKEQLMEINLKLDANINGKEEAKQDMYLAPILKRPRGRPRLNNKDDTFTCGHCKKDYKMSYKEKHFSSRKHQLLSQQK